MTRKKLAAWLASTAALAMLVGCATPQIDRQKIGTPRSVVLTDVPNLVPAATIQIVITNWPQFYFNGQIDGFYAFNGEAPPLANVGDSSAAVNQAVTNQIAASPRPVSVGAGAAAGAVGGIVGGLIDISAADTQKRAAEFPALVQKTLPNDLRADLMKALRESLEAKGIQVRVAEETHNAPPRLYWPANDAEGKALMPASPFANNPPVDADLLVQVAAVAVYAAPGPLNAYERRVGIGLAIFDGRSRKFLGWQAIPFKSPDSKFDYHRYDSLVADIAQAGPALHSALLSLVPQAAGVISGGGR